VIFDYGAPKAWRLTIARMTRIPERWVWVLDLQQHFPAIDREWFLHDPAHPEQIAAAFCPECFHDQIATRRPLHLKAEWAGKFDLMLNGYRTTKCVQNRIRRIR
jgi:hypothetical protein